jgi:hypothetical protein
VEAEAAFASSRAPRWEGEGRRPARVVLALPESFPYFLTVERFKSRLRKLEKHL